MCLPLHPTSVVRFLIYIFFILYEIDFFSSLSAQRVPAFFPLRNFVPLLIQYSNVLIGMFASNNLLSSYTKFLVDLVFSTFFIF